MRNDGFYFLRLSRLVLDDRGTIKHLPRTLPYSGVYCVLSQSNGHARRRGARDKRQEDGAESHGDFE